uniref:MIP33352p1 n=1 Tax=Drosophila melanogaster TaxID=7227 RepID=H9ZYP7_DROME|nr:MIP33352p1 [Drosophila melanogaster]
MHALLIGWVRTSGEMGAGPSGNLICGEMALQHMELLSTSRKCRKFVFNGSQLKLSSYVCLLIKSHCKYVHSLYSNNPQGLSR